MVVITGVGHLLIASHLWISRGRLDGVYYSVSLPTMCRLFHSLITTTSTTAAALFTDTEYISHIHLYGTQITLQ